MMLFLYFTFWVTYQCISLLEEVSYVLCDSFINVLFSIPDLVQKLAWQMAQKHANPYQWHTHAAAQTATRGAIIHTAHYATANAAAQYATANTAAHAAANGPNHATANASHAAAHAAANGPNHAAAHYATANSSHAGAHAAANGPSHAAAHYATANFIDR